QRPGLRPATRHSGRYGRALRAGRDEDRRARPDRRRARDSRRERLGERPGRDGPAGGRPPLMSHRLDRHHYADLYGPTTGDRVRLGDTGLVAEVEADATVYGDECKFGGGKVLRDGMGQAAGVPDARALDCVITNALIVD